VKWRLALAAATEEDKLLINGILWIGRIAVIVLGPLYLVVKFTPVEYRIPLGMASLLFSIWCLIALLFFYLRSSAEEEKSNWYLDADNRWRKRKVVSFEDMKKETEQEYARVLRQIANEEAEGR
jgi:hypothetical protein